MISLFIFNIFIFNFIEYQIHVLSHSSKYGGILNKEHWKHHFIDYPPSKLTKKFNCMNYVSYGQLYYFTVILPFYIMFYLLLSKYNFILFLGESSIYIYITNTLHNHYHMTDSTLNKYRFFLILKKNHHYHHINTSKNYNITLPICDILFNTFKY